MGGEVKIKVNIILLEIIPCLPILIFDCICGNLSLMDLENEHLAKKKKHDTTEKSVNPKTTVTSVSLNKHEYLTDVDFKLKWKQVTAEGLDLDYCSNLFSKQKADQILNSLEENIEYFSGKLAKVFVYGKWHNVPRKQVAFGEPGLCYKFSGISVPSQPWPAILLEIKEKLFEVTGFIYNFVLVNRYKDGTDYMAEHRDNEKELDPYTPIASISFGQPRDFVFTHGSSKKKNKTLSSSKVFPSPVKLVLEHGSLLLMKYPTNIHWYHSLPRRKTARGVRINLTFRKLIMNNCTN